MDIGRSLAEVNWLITMSVSVVLSVVLSIAANLLTPRAAALLATVFSVFARRRLQALEREMARVDRCAASLTVFIATAVAYLMQFIVVGLFCTWVSVVSVVASMLHEVRGEPLRIGDLTIGVEWTLTAIGYVVMYFWVRTTLRFAFFLKSVSRHDRYRAKAEQELAGLKARLAPSPMHALD